MQAFEFLDVRFQARHLKRLGQGWLYRGLYSSFRFRGLGLRGWSLRFRSRGSGRELGAGLEVLSAIGFIPSSLTPPYTTQPPMFSLN